MKTIEQFIGHYDDLEKTKKYFEAVKEASESSLNGVDANVFNHLKIIFPKNLSLKNVLDIGCGDACWSEYFSRSGAIKIFALDKSSVMLNLAKQRITKSGCENVRLIQGDMNELPIRNRSIDMAFSSFSMMYFKNLKQILTGIAKVLKTNGKIFIATNIFFPNQDEVLFENLKGQSVSVRLGFEKEMMLENLVQPLEQYENGLRDAGFTIEKCVYFEPEGVEIDDSYEHKDALILKKVVFVARKK